MSDNDTSSGTKQQAQRRPRHRSRRTWEVAFLFPHQGKWTEDDYLDLEAFHGRHPLLELSRGRLEVLPMPTELHQLIMVYFFECLKGFTATQAPGIVLFAGMKIKLATGRFRQPDILYMKAENAHRRHEPYWDGADLVMEVVSGDAKDRKRDLETKPREYAEARIPEYWIFDPQQQLVRVLTLDGAAYKLHGEFGPDTQATSVLLPGFVLAVDRAFNPPGSK